MRLAEQTRSDPDHRQHSTAILRKTADNMPSEPWHTLPAMNHTCAEVDAGVSCALRYVRIFAKRRMLLDSDS
jgi:hypothetical protein